MTTDTLAAPATHVDPGAVDGGAARAADTAIEGLYLYPHTDVGADAEPAYAWRQLHDGQWSARGEGDVAALLASVEQWPAHVVFVVPGHRVVTRTVAVAPGERRYFKKLVPFQLEEDIVDDVSELHFAFGPLAAETVDLAYCQRQQLDSWLAPFNGRELPVTHIVSAAALLPAPGVGQWVLLRDANQLYFRLSDTLYGAVQPDLARLYLKSLAAAHGRPGQLKLLASEAPLLADLIQALPESLAPLVAEQTVQGEPLAATHGAPNLAVDRYFPRIPLKRWLALVKVPALLLAAGLAVHLLVALVEWHTASSHTADLKAAITERYRAAVPAGAISDPLKQLRNQVNRLGNNSQGSNALQVLSQAVPVLTAIEGVEVKNLQFVNDVQELRLTIQAPALADIESLSSQFKARGFGAEVLSVNVNNGVHQARMKVTRK